MFRISNRAYARSIRNRIKAQRCLAEAAVLLAEAAKLLNEAAKLARAR